MLLRILMILMGVAAALLSTTVSNALNRPVCESSQAGGSPVCAAIDSKEDLAVPLGIHLMVFAPHPDDETLAAGGLIGRVLANGGKVSVVFMTNGDGYPEGVRLSSGRLRPSADDFIAYGEERRDEALQALAALGLKPEAGIFLGFPDGGIDDLWSGYWARIKPFVSPYTLSDHPPCRDSFSPMAGYAGVELKEEIVRTLRNAMPDWVVMPDPRDFHPDHYTTGVFVMDALRELNRKKGMFSVNKRFLTYLVHYKGYPVSTGWVKGIAGARIGGTTTISRTLSRTGWRHLALTPAELGAKERALSAHQSQFKVMGDFLKEFLRPCEMFGRLETAQILDIPEEYAALSRGTAGASVSRPGS